MLRPHHAAGPATVSGGGRGSPDGRRERRYAGSPLSIERPKNLMSSADRLMRCRMEARLECDSASRGPGRDPWVLSRHACSVYVTPVTDPPGLMTTGKRRRGGAEPLPPSLPSSPQVLHLLLWHCGISACVYAVPEPLSVTLYRVGQEEQSSCLSGLEAGQQQQQQRCLASDGMDG